MYLMIENSMCEGIATILHRHARANNPFVEGYDPSKPSSWLSYLDYNNLYGGDMSQPLPVGNFRFFFQEKIADFDVMKIPTHGDTGYIVECDLKNPPELHDFHSDFCREIKAKN